METHGDMDIASRDWRLNNLYKIQDENGDVVTFRMKPAQQKFYENLHYLNTILKGRQLGFTTLIQILMLDTALFEPNRSVGTVAHKLDAAKKIFKTKVKFPYDNLPEEIKQMVSVVQSSEGAMEFSNGSTFFVDSSLRSGTYQMLHISEYGALCAFDPERANEVKTGALNTVHAGQMITIESTAKGKAGHFYQLCKNSWHQTGKEVLGPMQPRFHFFPWFDEPSYSIEGDFTIASHYREYFKKLEKEYGIKLKQGQKNWYAQKADLMVNEEREDDKVGDMRQEFPSYPEEAFEAAVEGAYFIRQLNVLKTQERITDIPHDPSYPVDTFWDIGHNDATAIWFFQNIRGKHCFIDYYENSGEFAPFYANILKLRGPHNGGITYNYGTHYLPHDANSDTFAGEGPFKTLKALQIGKISVGKRVKDKGHAIEPARRKLPTVWFDASNCAEGLSRLGSYRKEWDQKRGIWKDKPVHDHNSNGADAFMEYAISYKGPKDKRPIEYRNLKRYA